MASHTATGEWKSFEIRMRRRRAERLVLRADVAAEAGCLEDARGLLDEARTLWAGVPGLADVENRIANADVPAVLTAKPRRWKELGAATAAVLFALTAAIVFSGGRSQTLSGELPAVQPAAVEQPVPLDQPAPIATAAASTEPVVREVAAPELTPAPPASVPTSLTREERERALPPVPLPEPRYVWPSVPAPGDATKLDPVALPAPSPAPVQPPTLVATTGPALSLASEAPPVQPPQETFVHAALARYARAYTDLDVEAAARVWPSVNRGALSRAFDSLAAQRITLGDCRVQVDGNDAHASCAGSATWTPKVGGREHTDARSWSFDLVKSAAGWQITGARVQNR